MLESIIRLKEKADKKDIKIISGVATSAMRTVSNGHKICKKITKKTDIEIKILSGNEEAQLLNFFNYKSFKKEEIKVPHQQVQKVKSDRWHPRMRKRAVIDEGHIYRYSIWTWRMYTSIYIL